MAVSAVRELVQKLMTDTGLRARLRHDSEGVFKGYDLTSEEKAAVLSVATRYGFEPHSRTIWEVASESWWAPQPEVEQMTS